ncbi:MAG: ribulose-phosphate 3-epimerase [Chlorobiota bacterium]|nr:MAG: ribulose-phosphate 3-epimerase [Chlorobiota bacterium]
MNKILAPSLLSADFTDLKGQIALVESAGAGFIHCDVMDGKFVPNITFGSLIVDAARRVTALPLDVHLMIEDPQHHIEDFVNAGADYITVHQEEVVHLDRVIHRIKELGAKAGVAINPATPVECLREVLEIVDLVLIMSVNPGFGGQKFIPNSLKKIKKLSEIRRMNSYNFLIEVDGGVNLQNAAEIAAAGCDVLVAGSAVYNSDNVKFTVNRFLEILNTRG